MEFDILICNWTLLDALQFSLAWNDTVSEVAHKQTQTPRPSVLFEVMTNRFALSKLRARERERVLQVCTVPSN